MQELNKIRPETDNLKEDSSLDNFISKPEIQSKDQTIGKDISKSAESGLSKAMSPKHDPHFHQAIPQVKPAAIQMAPNPIIDQIQEKSTDEEIEDSELQLMESPSKIMTMGGGDEDEDKNKQDNSFSIQPKFKIQSQTEIQDDEKSLQLKIETFAEPQTQQQINDDEPEFETSAMRKQKDGQNTVNENFSIERNINKTRGSGSPMPKDTRSFMENRFNVDFSEVNIHNDTNAHQLNQHLNAKAFTVGNDIYFGNKNYDTESNEGKELLAHELTHTIQQSNNTIRKETPGESSEEETEKSSKTETSPEVVVFTVVTDRDLPAASKEETGGEAIIWYASKIYGISEIDAMKIASSWTWIEDFRGVKNGTKFAVTTPFDEYVRGLITLYGKDDPQIKELLETYSEEVLKGGTIPKEKLTPEYMQNLSKVMRLQTLLTLQEFNYFKKWAEKAGVKVVKLEDATPEQLELIKNTLDRFAKGKYELLEEEGLLESFLLERDPEAEFDFKTLKDKIFKLDDAEIKEFTELTGFSLADLFLPITYRIEKIRILEEKLSKKGVSLKDLAQFLSYFRHKALSTTIAKLGETEEIVASEEEKYKDETHLNKLVELLAGKYKAKFSEADKLRAIALKRFNKTYKTEVINLVADESSGPDPVAITIYLLDSVDEERAAINISRHNPLAIEKTLVSVIYSHELRESELSPITKDMAKEKLYKDYPELNEANTKDDETSKDLRKNEAKDYKILADIFTDFRGLSRKSNEEIKKEIGEILKKKKENAASTKTKLREDPELVWELQPLVEMVMNELSITKDDNAGKIIWDKVADVQRASMFRSLGLGALGIVLGVAGFFSGGSTWLAGGLIAGGVAVSAFDLYFEAKSYSFHSGAAKATFDIALTADPSALGVTLAILGLLIDAVDVVKHSAKLIKGAAEGISTLKNADEIEKAVARTFDDLDAEGLIKKGVTKDEFVTKVTAVAATDAKAAKGFPEEFVRLIGEIKIDKVPQPMQTGLFRIYDTDPNTFTRIIKTLGDEPDALARLTEHVLIDPNITGSYFHINRLLGEEASDVFRYLGREGADAVNTLPDALAVIIRGGISDKVLIKEVLTNRRLHYGIINTATEPTKFNDLWAKFNKKKAEGTANYEFHDYVAYNGIKTTPGDEVVITLAKEMGVGFELMENPAKNFALLKRTESNLAAELSKNLAETSLPPHIHTKLNELLSGDIIGDLKLYKSAREKLIRKVNDLIGENIEGFDDYKKVMKLTHTAGSRGALGEASAIKFNIPPGASSGKKVTVKIDTITHPDWPAGKKVQVTIDNFISRLRKIGEIKVGTSFDYDQFLRYEFFYKFQDNPKIKSLLIEAGIPGGEIKGISYGLFPNPDDIVTVEKAVAAGEKITDPVRLRAQKVWDKISTDSDMISNLEVHFVDLNGRHYKITEKGVTYVKKIK